MTSDPRHPVIRVIDCHVARPTSEGSDTYEYLVLLRAPGRIDEGRRRIVTGKIEAFEAAWQTARRELAEETQLPLARLFVVPSVSRYYEWEHDRLNDIPIFLAVTEPGADAILDDEHVDFRWATRDEALDFLVWPAQREGLRAADLLLTDRHQPSHTLDGDLEGVAGLVATGTEIGLTSPHPFVGTIRNSWPVAPAPDPKEKRQRGYRTSRDTGRTVAPGHAELVDRSSWHPRYPPAGPHPGPLCRGTAHHWHLRHVRAARA